MKGLEIGGQHAQNSGPFIFSHRNKK